MTRAWSVLVLIAGSCLAACGNSETETPRSDLLAAETATISALAVSCSGCHAASGGAIVDISAYSQSQLSEALLNYRNAGEGSTVMHRLARGYSEAEIAQIAAYLGAGQ